MRHTIAAAAFAAAAFAQPAAAADCTPSECSAQVRAEFRKNQAKYAQEGQALQNEANRRWKAEMLAAVRANPDAGKAAFVASLRRAGVAEDDIQAAWANGVAYAISRYSD
jgi:hypothetical protein